MRTRFDATRISIHDVKFKNPGRACTHFATAGARGRVSEKSARRWVIELPRLCSTNIKKSLPISSARSSSFCLRASQPRCPHRSWDQRSSSFVHVHTAMSPNDHVLDDASSGNHGVCAAILRHHQRHLDPICLHLRCILSVEASIRGRHKQNLAGLIARFHRKCFAQVQRGQFQRIKCVPF